MPCAARSSTRLLHPCGEPPAEVRVTGEVDAVGVRSGHDAHPPGQARESAERRRDRCHLGRDTVVGVAGDDHASVARGRLRDAQSEVAGLGTGAREHHVLDRVRHRRQQVLGVVDDARVQVARVRAEQCRLRGDRRDDPRMCVTDRRHVVVGVQVLHSVDVVEMDALAAHELHGCVVEEPVRRSECGDAATDEVGRARRELADAIRIEVGRGSDGGGHAQPRSLGAGVSTRTHRASADRSRLRPV